MPAGSQRAAGRPKPVLISRAYASAPLRPSASAPQRLNRSNGNLASHGKIRRKQPFETRLPSEALTCPATKR